MNRMVRKSVSKGGDHSTLAGFALVVFDSSVLVDVILNQMGFRTHSAFNVVKVRKFMKGKNLAVVGTSCTEITNVILAMRNAGKLEEGYQLSPTEIMRRIDNILMEGYEKIDAKNRDYEEYLKGLLEMMDRIVERPDSETAKRWLRFKRAMLHDKCARREGENSNSWTRRKLRYLRNEARRNDVKILAKVMWLSHKRKICFVSDDGDHIIFDDWVRCKTEERMEICRPSDFR